MSFFEQGADVSMLHVRRAILVFGGKRQTYTLTLPLSPALHDDPIRKSMNHDHISFDD